jgi:hypothetical protein
VQDPHVGREAVRDDGGHGGSEAAQPWLQPAGRGDVGSRMQFFAFSGDASNPRLAPPAAEDLEAVGAEWPLLDAGVQLLEGEEGAPGDLAGLGGDRAVPGDLVEAAPARVLLAVVAVLEQEAWLPAASTPPAVMSYIPG